MRRIKKLALVALCLAAFAPLPAAAQIAEGQVFGDWRARCVTPPGATRHQCSIQFRVFNKEPRRQLLNVTIGFFGKNRAPGAVFNVPIGVYLPAGLTLSVPGAQVIRLVYDRCMPKACRAALALTTDMIAAMKKAERGDITIQDSRRKPLKLPLSLKGFTAGYDALSRQ
ncbi:MAG: invasion associated locus B family protein [Alphaproteobacteria bacterium]